MNELKETDKAYLAGFVDGEGCITINGHRTREFYTYSLRVIITQADRAMLERLRKRTGIGSIYRNTAERHVWMWAIVGKEAETFLRAIYPYMDIKKDQADVALQFRATVSNADFPRAGRGSGNVPDAILKLRSFYAKELKRLKRPWLEQEQPEPPDLLSYLDAQMELPGLVQ